MPGVLRVWLIRGLALLCICSLSTGSHFGREFLGPLKSSLIRDLPSNNIEFSAILASYSVGDTWTPLVAGLLAATLGTTWPSLIATSLILLGQSTLFLGRRMTSIGTMAAGLFIFGLGVSPLSVVQETIIVRFFSNHGLGVSLAFGLVAGKGASFVAALTSYPLAQNHGPLAPFFVATMLAIFSFSINILYLHASRWLASGSGVEPEVNEAPFSSTPITEAGALEHVTGKKRVILSDIAKLGDVFWLYLAMNFLSGAVWKPFPHIAANIIQLRYSYSESDAGKTASLLHAGGIVLYPICGFLADRFRRDAIVYKLSMLASVLTFSCYIWFLLPPTWTKSALPGVLFFGAGLGFAPLLLVLIAPMVVPSAYVATALGAHKSLESAGSTISLTLAGIILDEKIFKHPPKKPLDPSPIPSLRELPSTKSSPQSAIERVLFVFAFLNLLHLVCIWFLWKLEISKRAPNGYQILSGDTALPYESGEREENHLDRDAEHDHHHRISNESIDAPLSHDPPADLIASTSSIPTGLHGDGGFVVTEAEIARGRILFRISIALIVATWMFYSITLLMDLVERHGDD